MGLGQVRVSAYVTGSGEGLSAMTVTRTSSMLSSRLTLISILCPVSSLLSRYTLPVVTSSVCDGACRRDSERQLQPVPGGDLWDWIR